jgi:hypothetical protein
VQPAHDLAFLYFYSAGMLWSAPDRLAPVNPDDIALVNDLKHAGPRQQSPAHRLGPCWQVVVPTSMQVLDAPGDEGGADLPALGGAAP